jgi:hypothetical protein
MTPVPLPDPVVESKKVVNDILRDIHRGSPALLIDSPPGAGKTWTGIRIAATAWGLLGENVMVACWTNRQAIDFAVRLAEEFTKVPVQLFIREDLAIVLPERARDLRNLTVVHRAPDLGSQGVAVSNASKWVAYPIEHRYEWLLVDEAYQLPDYRFQQLVGMADRYVLVGDPGQIPPLVRADTSPWGTDEAGPQMPCPRALVARHPDVDTRQLPVSWRLPTDSAEIVRSSFYSFDFTSGDPEGRRRLQLEKGDGHVSDQVIDALAHTRTSLVAALLEEEAVGTEVDSEIAMFMARTVARLLERRAVVTDGEDVLPLEARHVGIATAHRAQVAEIDSCLRSVGLATGPDGAVVETPERWQGLERPVMLVQHPLAGLGQASSFDLERGRLCVMLSRHRYACLLVGRQGIDRTIDMHAHSGERFAGMPDEEYLGWHAHHEIWTRLEVEGRLIEV